MRAYQLQGDGNQLLGGTLRAGDHVDVVATSTYSTPSAASAGGANHATRTVLRNIFVLEPSISAAASSKLSGGASGNGSVILRLTDSQAQKLDFTINTAVRSGNYNPTWRLTLRSPLSAADSPESVTTIGSVLLDGLGAQQRARLEGKYQGGQ